MEPQEVIELSSNCQDLLVEFIFELISFNFLFIYCYDNKEEKCAKRNCLGIVAIILLTAFIFVIGLLIGAALALVILLSLSAIIVLAIVLGLLLILTVILMICNKRKQRNANVNAVVNKNHLKRWFL